MSIASLGNGRPDLEEERDEVVLDLDTIIPSRLIVPSATANNNTENEYELLQHTLMALKDQEKALLEMIAAENKKCTQPLHLPSRRQLMEALLRASDEQLRSGVIDDRSRYDALTRQRFKHDRVAKFSVRPISDSDAILGMFHSLTFTKWPVSIHKSVDHQFYQFSGAALLDHDGTKIRLLHFSCDTLVHTNDYSVASFNLDIDYPLTIRNDLHPFIESCRAQKDLSRALYGLSTYSEIAMKRHIIFQTIIKQYPIADNDGTWPVGHTIAFAKRPDNGYQLLISWRIILTADNQLAEAQSELQAFVTAPVITEPLSKLNSAFTSLLKEQGVINAISVIYNTLYK